MYVLLFLISLAFYSSSKQSPNPVNAYQWKYRQVLIFSPSLQDDRLKQQRLQCKQNSMGWMERKLIYWEITPARAQGPEGALDQQTRDRLYAIYTEGKDQYQAILIGLDGTVKLRTDEVIDESLLFSTIDAMPMRQAEIRRQKGN